MSDTLDRMARAWCTLDDGGVLYLTGSHRIALMERMRALLDGAPAESEADRAALRAAARACPTCTGHGGWSDAAGGWTACPACKGQRTAGWQSE